MSQEEASEHPTPSEAIEAGLYYFAREDYLAARKWWEYAIAIDPHNARVHECLRILGRTVGEDPGTGDLRPSAPAPSDPGRAQNQRATVPAPADQANAMEAWTRPSTRPGVSTKNAAAAALAQPTGALEAWSRPSSPPHKEQTGDLRRPPQSIPVAPAAAEQGGAYPSMPGVPEATRPMVPEDWPAPGSATNDLRGPAGASPRDVARAGSRELARGQASRDLPKPSRDLPIPPGSRDLPKPPGSRDLPIPPGSRDLPKPPGSRDLPVPPGSRDLPIPPGARDLPIPPGSRDLPKPPGSRDLPIPPGSRDLPVPPGSRDLPIPPGSRDLPKPPGSRDLPRPPASRDVPRALGSRDVPRALGSRDVPRALGSRDVPRALGSRDVPVAPGSSRDLPRSMPPSSSRDLPRQTGSLPAAAGGINRELPLPTGDLRGRTGTTRDVRPGTLDFDPLGFDAAWEGVERVGNTQSLPSPASPAEEWSRPSQPPPAARAPPSSWDPGEQVRIDGGIGVEPKKRSQQGAIEVSASDPEWEAMMRQIAAGGLVTGPEGLGVLDPLTSSSSNVVRVQNPASSAPMPSGDLRRAPGMHAGGVPANSVDIVITGLDDGEDNPFDERPPTYRSQPPPFMQAARGARSSVPPSVFTPPSLPEARTFDVSHEEKMNASSPGITEPSPEEILGDSSPGAAQVTQVTRAPVHDDDFELNVEEPEESSHEPPPNAIDYALSAFETASNPEVFSVAPPVDTPWDYGPTESSAVTVAQDVNMDDDAVADYAPNPPLDRAPLYQQPNVSVPPATARMSMPARMPSMPAKPSKPVARPGESSGRLSVHASGADPSAMLERARSMLLLHDFDGALELLESIPTNHPVYEDAKEVLGGTRSHLESIYASKIGPFDHVPKVLLSGQQLIWLNLNHRAGFILSQIDGNVSYEDLISLSGMPRLDTLKIIASLLHEGVIGS